MGWASPVLNFRPIEINKDISCVAKRLRVAKLASEWPKFTIYLYQNKKIEFERIAHVTVQMENIFLTISGGEITVLAQLDCCWSTRLQKRRSTVKVLLEKMGPATILQANWFLYVGCNSNANHDDFTSFLASIHHPLCRESYKWRIRIRDNAQKKWGSSVIVTVISQEKSRWTETIWFYWCKGWAFHLLASYSQICA